MDAVGRGGSRVTAAKLVAVLVGVALFGTGIRWDEPGMRWAGIAIVALAWLLRFARHRTPATGQFPDDTR